MALGLWVVFSLTAPISLLAAPASAAERPIEVLEFVTYSEVLIEDPAAVNWSPSDTLDLWASYARSAGISGAADLSIRTKLAELPAAFPAAPGASRADPVTAADLFTAGIAWQPPLDGFAGMSRMLVALRYYDLETTDSLTTALSPALLSGARTDGFDVSLDVNSSGYLQDLSARLSLRYLGSLSESCGGLAADPAVAEWCADGRDTTRADRALYTDLQATWAPQELLDGDWVFTIGVNNLLDEKPALCLSCDPNSLDGSVFPYTGQYWYARIIYGN